MTKSDPLAQVSSRTTPQSQPARPDQVENSAGGYVFTTGDDVQIHRFLTLGVTGGTFYVGEREHVQKNTDLVAKVARERGRWLVDQVLAVSVAGRAPRQQPGLFALAQVIAHGDDDARAYALDALPRVARTASTLFTLLNYVQAGRGWGRGLRRAVARWYLDRPVDALAYQLVKYRQRDGWTHRDVLRQAHPRATEPDRNALLAWTAGKTYDDQDLTAIVGAFEALKHLTDPRTAAAVVREYRLPWEAIPDSLVNQPEVLTALSEDMPQGALVRQLPRLTRAGVLDDPAVLARVVAQLQDAERLARARVHPVALLIAAKTYARGQGRGSSWSPKRQIVDALDAAFYAAFRTVEPAGRRTLVALDVSGSMGAQVGDTGLTAREASAAMALVTIATEPSCDVVGFTSSGANTLQGNRRRWGGANAISELDISPRRRLDDIVRYTQSLDFGGTDCALPMLWAAATERTYDTFVIYTDNETWAGDVHPSQALERYRQRYVGGARLVVVGMTSTGFTIADPTDPLQLDIAGFDSITPTLISDFSAGRL